MCGRWWSASTSTLRRPALRRTRQMPDMFVYTFQVADGDPVTLPEQALSGDLHELAALVLRRDR